MGVGVVVVVVVEVVVVVRVVVVVVGVVVEVVGVVDGGGWGFESWWVYMKPPFIPQYKSTENPQHKPP